MRSILALPVSPRCFSGLRVRARTLNRRPASRARTTPPPWRPVAPTTAINGSWFMACLPLSLVTGGRMSPRVGSRAIRCDEDLHRARVPESLESGGGVVDAGDLGSEIGDLEPS